LQPRPIFVLGAERSGASVVTDLIRRWGAYVGAPALAGAEAPPRDFTRQLLAAAGGTAWRPGLDADLAALADQPAWRDRALALVRPLSARDRPWLWTLPGPSLIIPFWEKLFPDLLCVVVVRSPLDGARSFAACQFPAELAQAIQIVAYFGFRWQSTLVTLLALCERHPDHLLVSYEALNESPSEQLRRLALFLDRSTGAAETCDERLGMMLKAVDQSLWHQRAGAGFFDLPQVTDVQKNLFRYLQRRLAGAAEPFDALRFAVPCYAWEYLRNFDVFFELQQQMPPPSGPGSDLDPDPEGRAT
jgi:hypothetical protein